MNWDLMGFSIFGIVGIILIILSFVGFFAKDFAAFLFGAITIVIAIGIFSCTFIWCDTGKKIRTKINILPPPTPAEKIDLKIRQLESLHEALQQKLGEVQILKQNYTNGALEAQRDAINESNSRGIKIYDQAIKDARISYDIQLIQRRLALADKMNETAIRLGTGIEQVRFLGMKAQDDLGIAKVFTSQEAQKLMKDINFVIDQYQPDAKEINLQLDEKEFISPEKVWELIQQEQQKQRGQ